MTKREALEKAEHHLAVAEKASTGELRSAHTRLAEAYIAFAAQTPDEPVLAARG